MADTVQEQVRVRRDLEQEHDLAQYLPTGLRGLSNPQTEIPKLAKDPEAVSAIAAAVDTIPTEHHLHLSLVGRASAEFIAL